MRGWFEQEFHTLDYVSAVVGATLIWGVPAAVIVWIDRTTDVDAGAGPVLPVFWVVGYLVTVALMVKRKKEE